jgi:hypothetical protein
MGICKMHAFWQRRGDRQVRPNRDAARKVRPGHEKMQISRARFFDAEST